jgi:sirohydrochlorin cobaltochelatase
MKTAVMICGHGSRDRDAVAECARAAAGLTARLPEHDVAFGYLEFARPSIREGLAALAARGAQHILVLPAMLSAASHVRRDLPREVERFAVDFPRIEVRFGRQLSTEPKLLEAAVARIADCERHGTADVPRRESLLLVIGRGTRDAEANANVGKLARLLADNMEFGRVERGYGGTAEPLTEPALRHAATLGFKRIVVFPYFLFTGVLVKRVYAASDRVAADRPAIEIIKAPYLGDHPLVLDCLADRVAELMGAGFPAH